MEERQEASPLEGNRALAEAFMEVAEVSTAEAAVTAEAVEGNDKERD
jgi:hypothetical protein